MSQRRFADLRAVDVLLNLLADNRTLKEATFELGITVNTAKRYIWEERKRTGTQMLYNLVADHVRSTAAMEAAANPTHGTGGCMNCQYCDKAIGPEKDTWVLCPSGDKYHVACYSALMKERRTNER